MSRMMVRRTCAAFAAMLCFVVAATPAAAHDPSFSAWLEKLRGEAASQGVSQATLAAALSGLQPIPRIIELDRSQPEVTQTFAEYMARRVTPERVGEGRRALRENRPVLEAVGAKYGVQPRFIVALWGVESRYGKYTGGFRVIAALATLLAPAVASAGDAAAGKTPYTTNCVSCHGETGKGDGPVGLVLQPPPPDFPVGDFTFDPDEA